MYQQLDLTFGAIPSEYEALFDLPWDLAPTIEQVNCIAFMATESICLIVPAGFEKTEFEADEYECWSNIITPYKAYQHFFNISLEQVVSFCTSPKTAFLELFDRFGEGRGDIEVYDVKRKLMATY